MPFYVTEVVGFNRLVSHRGHHQLPSRHNARFHYSFHSSSSLTPSPSLSLARCPSSKRHSQPWPQRWPCQGLSTRPPCRSIAVIRFEFRINCNEFCRVQTYLPLGKSQLHLASLLGLDSLVLFQASADSAGRDGQVAIVAVPSPVSRALPRQLPRRPTP